MGHENMRDEAIDLVVGRIENRCLIVKNFAIAGNKALNLTESLTGIKKNKYQK